jgi:hypothetical protein
MKSADEEVAMRIIDRFRSRELFSEPFLIKLQPKIAAGTLSAEDWKLAVEIDQSAEKKTIENENS